MREVRENTAMMLLVLAVAMALPASAANQVPAQESVSKAPAPEETIRKELDSGVTAWNHGDLKGFMHSYWHSKDLTFFAATQASSGWDEAYQRYRTAYSGKDKPMGKLSYSDVQVEMLSPDAAFVRGSWQLTMKDGSKRQGLFTLVWKQFSEGWRIIHDHSS